MINNELQWGAIAEFTRNGQTIVRFRDRPDQRDSDRTVMAEALLRDRRSIRSSSSTAQLRPVIQTIVELGRRHWGIELTLTNRDAMGLKDALGTGSNQTAFSSRCGEILHSKSSTIQPSRS